MVQPTDIPIEVEPMVDGLVELLDEIGDLALNRVVRLTTDLEGGFNPTLVTPENVNRFKLTWFVAMGELMLHEMRGDKVSDVVEAYYDEMRYQATERQEAAFLDDITGRVRDAIAADEAYKNEGIFNTPSANGGGAKNAGLGVTLAAVLSESAFADNDNLTSIFDKVCTTIEEEFINAYGHSTIACAKFVVG